MAECQSLGQSIGLHKRVVQVWFQNARAKERKARTANGQVRVKCVKITIFYRFRTQIFR